MALDMAGMLGTEQRPDGSWRFRDEQVYGRTTPADRAYMSAWIASERDERPDAARRAAEHGRAAYAYACGWVDALGATRVGGERVRDGAWVSSALSLAWTYAEEAECAQFALLTDRAGMRHGFSHAWQLALERNGLAL